MKAIHHRDITEQALRPHFSPEALEMVVRANLGQDAPQYQFIHDHFHYDNNAFAAGDAYLAEQARIVIETLQTPGGIIAPARAAFGRLTHTVQDFYAHSNYIELWRELHPGAGPDSIHPYLSKLTRDPRLKSGRIYPPLEYFSYIPAFKPLVTPLLPRDSHAWMNKDDPTRPGFDFARAAAVKRTALELEDVRRKLSVEQFSAFTGR